MTENNELGDLTGGLFDDAGDDVETISNPSSAVASSMTDEERREVLEEAAVSFAHAELGEESPRSPGVLRAAARLLRLAAERLETESKSGDDD